MAASHRRSISAQHSFNDIAETLGVPGSEIVRKSRFGTWLMAPPVPDSKNESIIAEVAGRTPYIQFKDGTLKYSL
jgi:hypothetical protein